MPEPSPVPGAAADEVVAATGARVDVVVEPKADRDDPRQLARHRAETERMRVLVDFLSRPIHAHGGAESPDPDIITAYNLAVEAALQWIRRAALGGL